MGEHEDRILIGQRIAAARLARRLSQEDVAASIGVHFQTVSKWERGILMPSAPQLKGLCELLGVTADYLVGLSEVM